MQDPETHQVKMVPAVRCASGRLYQWLGGYGVYYDADTDLHLTLHRAYSCSLKRFISADPLGIDGGVNLYVYCGNNPINRIDPYGLAWYNDWHYDRNENNQSVSLQEAQDQWTQMSDDKSIYHRMGSGNEDNLKFVSPDGSSEAVFNPNGTVVTDPANMATYNYSSPNEGGGIGHVFADVLPYYLWGNSEDDPTTFWERLTASYKGEETSPCK